MSKTVFNLDSLETRVHLAGQHPIGINFTDEASWTSQYSYAVTQAKALGITAVRLWMGVEDYSDRPNAWDSVSAFRDRDTGDGHQRQNLPPEVMRAAFKLSREGFSVNLVVQTQFGNVPDSDSQVRGLMRHLMDATETPSSTIPLKNVIDTWEIGNEVDNGFYWAPSGSNKTAGLQQYVDDFLIPAADELHAGSDDEKVISAGVSYNPSDLKTILDRLQSVGRLDAIDYAGFHPYGIYDPANPSVNEPKSRTLTAKSYADAVGKKMVATEWNIRGFGNDGSRNTEWGQAIDDVFKQAILPNYEMAFYFAMVNNWSGRGGNTSARPGSLLKHDGSVIVTPTSSYSNLENYYNSPLQVSEPFYSTFKQWQHYIAGNTGGSGGGTTSTGSISGVVFGDSNNNGLYDTGDSIGTSRVVFIDANGNSQLDSGEKQTTSNASGIYTFANLAAGEYKITRVFPSGYRISNSSNGYITVTLAAGQTITTAHIGSTNQAASGGSGGNTGSGVLGSISGLVFGDSNNNGIYDSGDSIGASRVVYIDANGNGKLDSGEIQTTSNASGIYKFSNLAAGSYMITRVFPTGYRMSNSNTNYLSITLSPGQVITSANIGSTNKAPTSGGGNTGSGSVGSIAGLVFNDSNGNGTKDSTESIGSGKTVYIDTNNNNQLDSGEKSVVSDSSGNYKLSGLASGTYRIRRIVPAGYKLTTPASGFHLITLNPGQGVTAMNFGTKSV